MLHILKDAISLGFYLGGLFQKDKNCANELVLVYHSITDMNPEDDPYKLNLHPRLLRQQLKYLCSTFAGNIVATFDDGFNNFFDNAFPIILQYNIKTIIFVTTDFINGRISFDHLFGHGSKIRPLRWSQLKEIAEAGIEIGAHSLTHPNLTKLKEKQAYKEISDSKKYIEDAIGKEVKYFAYPYGSQESFNTAIKEIVKQSGYNQAYTNIMGFNTPETDLYELRRIRIYSNDNMFRFKMKIKGAYNWVDRLLS